jgi:hypothetical protein
MIKIVENPAEFQLKKALRPFPNSVGSDSDRRKYILNIALDNASRNQLRIIGTPKITRSDSEKGYKISFSFTDRAMAAPRRLAFAAAAGHAGNIVPAAPADNILPKGGIDFNAANLNLQIKRDGNGVPLALSQQDMAQLNSIEGLEPVILVIKPAGQMPLFSQLQTAQ